MKINIRPATAEDRHALWRVHTQAIRLSAAGYYGAAQIEAWAGRLTPDGYQRYPDCYLVAATEEGRVVGFGELNLSAWRGGSGLCRPGVRAARHRQPNPASAGRVSAAAELDRMGGRCVAERNRVLRTGRLPAGQADHRRLRQRRCRSAGNADDEEPLRASKNHVLKHTAIGRRSGS